MAARTAKELSLLPTTDPHLDLGRGGPPDREWSKTKWWSLRTGAPLRELSAPCFAFVSPCLSWKAFLADV